MFRPYLFLYLPCKARKRFECFIMIYVLIPIECFIMLYVWIPTCSFVFSFHFLQKAFIFCFVLDVEVGMCASFCEDKVQYNLLCLGNKDVLDIY